MNTSERSVLLHELVRYATLAPIEPQHPVNRPEFEEGSII